MIDFKNQFVTRDWNSTSMGPIEGWPEHLSAVSAFMLDNFQPFLLLWGDDKTILFNRAFADLLGESAMDLMGSTYRDFWGEIWGVADPFGNTDRNTPQLAENIPLKTRAEGIEAVRYYTVAYTPLRNREGRTVGSAISFTDNTLAISIMQRSERERGAILRLFEEAPSFIAIGSVPSGRFVFANSAYLKLVGRADIIGQTVEEVFPELVDQGIISILNGVITTGTRFVADRMPLEFKSEGGEPQVRYLNFIYEPMKDAEGSVIGIFVEGHDVTGEVEGQAQISLLQSQLIHLARVSAMETMATTLAHELNQPLSAILNYVAGLERMIEQSVETKDILTPLAQIGMNATSAGNIIRSLRSMTGQADTKREPFIPDEVILGSVNLIKLDDDHGVELKCQLGDGQPVLGDPIQIQQVIFNLLRNGCQAARQAIGGKVVVTSRDADKHVVITVEDNGPGIAPENMASLFTSFFSTKDDGMGMGLSISRTIVDRHGGNIWAENRSEGGARFCFTLPFAG